MVGMERDIKNEVRTPAQLGARDLGNGFRYICA